MVGRMNGEVEPDTANRPACRDRSEQIPSTRPEFCNDRRTVLVEEGCGAIGHRIEDRSADSRIEQRTPRVDRLAGVARIERLPVLRLQQVHIPAAGDVI